MAGAPLSPLDQLGRVLDGTTGLTLRLAESACAAERAVWIAAMDAAACRVTDAYMHCVATSATDPFEQERALCETKTAALAPEPAWAPKVATFARALGSSVWEVEPVTSPPELPVFRVTIDGAEHAMARIAGRWRPLSTPLTSVADRQRIVRAFDASLLAGQPAVAVIHEGYDGGSEMGVHTSVLEVLCDRPAGLRACGSIQIGSLAWALAAEDRGNHPGAATSLRSRPHVEVLLAPSIRFPDRLHLAVEISRLTEPFGEELVDPVRAVASAAGEWRLERGTFVKVN